MKYDGYQVGIVIKSLRIQRNLTKEALAEDGAEETEEAADTEEADGAEETEEAAE